MRRIKEVLRLKYELGLGQRQIARSCSIGQATVNDYRRRAEAAGLRWPLTEEWDDDRIERELFGKRNQPSTPHLQRTPPDFPSIHDQLRQHRHLTLQLLWVEYRQAHPDGYGYSHFCDHYQKWRRKLDVVLRQEHKAGEKIFVDWAGPTIPVHERTQRAGLAGIAVRRCPGGQFLYVCRGDSRSADGIVDSRSRPRV
jgi:hypothetical protein